MTVPKPAAISFGSRSGAVEFDPSFPQSSREPVFDTPLERLLQHLSSDVVSRDVNREETSVIPFLQASSLLELSRLWFGTHRLHVMSVADCLCELAEEIAKIERLLETQVNEILHHPEFQRLESSWRGLAYLVNQASEQLMKERRSGGTATVLVCLLSATKQELRQSFQRAVAIDESALFAKVYEQRFGQAGGEPLGLIVGDYSFSEDHQDVFLLQSLAGVAAAAFAPFVAAASPSLIGAVNFQDLDRPFSLQRLHSGQEFQRWSQLRESTDSRFLALTVPRILLRSAYHDDGSKPQGFRFEESLTGQSDEQGMWTDRERYLWGNAAFGLAAVAIRAFVRSGWFADLRGAAHGEESGGVIADIPYLPFTIDCMPGQKRPGVEVSLSERWEQELCQAGLIPVSSSAESGRLSFRSNPSVHEVVATRNEKSAEAENEQLASMLQYVLCASRFAHHLKVMIRNKLGTVESIEELQDELNGRWLQGYVSSTNVTDPVKRAEYPLREARLEIQEIPGRSGFYRLIMELAPHYQLDDVAISIRLESEIS